jgi:hypothetical protein
VGELLPIGNCTTILNCALELFAARGYDAVGVQEIAEAAGITKYSVTLKWMDKVASI